MSSERSIQNQPQKSLVPTLYVVIGVLVGILLAAGLIAVVILLARAYPVEISTVRDIFIILLALEGCLFGVAFIILLVMLIRLINMLEFEIKPILEETQETVQTVKGTTTFVSKNVVKPVAKVGGLFAGARRGLKVLFGDPRKNLPD